MAGRTRKWALWLLLLLLLPLGAFVTRAFWLPWFAEHLILAEAPQKADIIVVLAGDEWGYRVIKASQLVQQGYAPLILVSGPFGMYEHWESDLAIDLAVKHGFPRSIYAACNNYARNTRDEAKDVLKDLRARGVKHMLLVTSEIHTRRAASVYRELAPDIQITVVASNSKPFRPSEWWKPREGQKAVLTEWLKTIANKLGI